MLCYPLREFRLVLTALAALRRPPALTSIVVEMILHANGAARWQREFGRPTRQLAEQRTVVTHVCLDLADEAASRSGLAVYAPTDHRGATMHRHSKPHCGGRRYEEWPDG